MNVKTSPVKIIGRHTFTIRDADTGEIKRQETIENIVVTAGRTVLARLLSGDATYTGEVTHGALGSSTTAPANGDTQLGAEIVGARVATSSQTYAGNIAYLSFFFPSGSLITYEEFATFIDGSLTINSGQLFTHALISGAKQSNETLTIDTNYTIT